MSVRSHGCYKMEARFENSTDFRGTDGMASLSNRSSPQIIAVFCVAPWIHVSFLRADALPTCMDRAYHKWIMSSENNPSTY